MDAKINRRKWLKSSSLLASGIFAGLPALAGKMSKKYAIPEMEFVSEYELTLQEMKDLPPMKARLLSNENAFGPSEKAKQAIINAINDSFMYPRDARQEFTEMIAEKEGVSPEQVIIGAGSTELLMAASLYYGLKGGKVISGDPSYMSLVRMTGMYGADWEKVPLTKDFKLDLEEMEKRVSDDTSLVYICNPNNPTGTALDTGKLKDFCKSVSKKKPIFLDEAYIDYAGGTEKKGMGSLLNEGYDVIIARTFSKAHAFAGLRIGYCIAQPETIDKIKKFSTRGGTTAATSLYGAIASFKDEEFMKYSVAKNEEAKAYTYGFLKDLGYDYIPSETSFILFPINMKGEAFKQKMLEKGIGIKVWEFNDQHWCRVSMHKIEKLKMFETALRELPG
ncbi:MAG: histidinol-phosphate transaminase [Bacteroidota bacterium]